MLTRAEILRLIPHQGAMCLLDRVLEWSPEDITCAASSHLLPGNPLSRGGVLTAICGVEYGLQAAALHGALLHQPPAKDFPLPLREGVGGRGPAREESRKREPARVPGAATASTATTLPTPPPAFLAALRAVELRVDRLDDPALGELRVTATAEAISPAGSIYRFAVASGADRPLLRGRATIAAAWRAE